ncbi:hypothetical protein QMK33_06515 [Hymenobacter sp. H14-R3]|uniref:hypothetical protein n=1 Tax=Hymenobacter sp. H14-R3 TaxID=3046308 RepID=UPI0024BB2E4C|nr:hypothetical protein [Hymenobacter sp. H14-R3]MDJ0364799.1 hypothetical protein [Hymenobacter sp. H14-R3]
MMWEPITLETLYDKVLAAEEEMIGEIWRFWQLIQVFPEKWQQVPYGEEGGGFWVVAICGKQIIWYNDIEEGFNISDYDQYGQIKDYWCNQDELRYPVQQLLSLIKMGGEGFRRAGPPQKIE